MMMCRNEDGRDRTPTPTLVNAVEGKFILVVLYLRRAGYKTYILSQSKQAFTFRFSHLADAFVQSYVQGNCIFTSGAVRGSVSCSRTLSHLVRRSGESNRRHS